MATPAPAHERAITSCVGLGRLRKNGTRRVRITKMTNVCVASDSTNHPVWNRDSPAWNTQA